MNSNRSPSGLRKRSLIIYAPEEGHETPTAVEIRFVRGGWAGDGDLPALWSRPRRGQETRKTVEPAPRHLHLVRKSVSTEREERYDITRSQ